MATPQHHKLLVFHIGHVGDTLMILPSLRVLWEAFPDANFTLLCDRVIGSKYILGAEIFKGTGFYQTDYRSESYKKDAGKIKVSKDKKSADTKTSDTVPKKQDPDPSKNKSASKKD